MHYIYMYINNSKYWDIFTPHRTCPKINKFILLRIVVSKLTGWVANSADPDAASDLSLHGVHRPIFTNT